MTTEKAIWQLWNWKEITRMEREILFVVYEYTSKKRLITQKGIGRKVGLNKRAVQYRIAKLRKKLNLVTIKIKGRECFYYLDGIVNYVKGKLGFRTDQIVTQSLDSVAQPKSKLLHQNSTKPTDITALINTIVAQTFVSIRGEFLKDINKLSEEVANILYNIFNINLNQNNNINLKNICFDNVKTSLSVESNKIVKDTTSINSTSQKMENKKENQFEFQESKQENKMQYKGGPIGKRDLRPVEKVQKKVNKERKEKAKKTEKKTKRQKYEAKKLEDYNCNDFEFYFNDLCKKHNKPHWSFSWTGAERSIIKKYIEDQSPETLKKVLDYCFENIEKLKVKYEIYAITPKLMAGNWKITLTELALSKADLEKKEKPMVGEWSGERIIFEEPEKEENQNKIVMGDYEVFDEEKEEKKILYYVKVISPEGKELYFEDGFIYQGLATSKAWKLEKEFEVPGGNFEKRFNF